MKPDSGASAAALEAIGWRGLATDDRARIERIASELERAIRTLRDVEPAVAFFGSARSAEGTAEYELAREVANGVARMGFNVLTGGGPGVMEAANRGCREGGGLSVGLSIRLPVEQSTNAFVDRECAFDYFFARKLMFVRHSCAFLIFPGGFGTLDETFEALTLVQTHKIPHFPVLLFGGEFWSGLAAQLDAMERRRLIAPGDRDRLRPVSTLESALEILRCCHEGLCAELHKPPLRKREGLPMPALDGRGDGGA
jgi:uncharacterized protein (TIGR00730 family)